MKALSILGLLILAGLVSYANYYIERSINQSYYESATQMMVCKMVRPENLTEENRRICSKDIK